MGFSRKLSIRRSPEIKQVLDHGRKFSDRLLRINVLPAEPAAPSRAGFVVPKFGRTIVLRNRLKRRFHELFRANPSLSRGYLVVLRATPESYEADFSELRDGFTRLADKIVHSIRRG